MPSNRKVKMLKDRIGVSESVADELLILSNDDVDMAERASRASKGLNQCKARIINERLSILEGRNNG